MKVIKEKYKKLIDYSSYVEFMESKKVRHGKNRTYTLVDFITDEELEELKSKKDYDLSRFNPTPKPIDEHFKFANKIHRELLKKYPDDEFLKSLEEEEYQVLKVTTDWYKDYEIRYPIDKLEELRKVEYPFN